jgi:hypothetical protein
MSFIQIIEFQTSKPEEIDELISEWISETDGRRTASRATTARDRDAEGSYLQIVEFPSYEQAMANSDLPETGSFGRRLADLCDGPPAFRNLDITRTEQL